ncbi:MAG: glycosyltransferase family 2 protein [Alphaproteobacteria bacterium]
MIVTTWSYNFRKPPLAKENMAIDIFVPVYKEPIDIIRRTLISAQKIQYPHKTFVLDDGQRAEIKTLAEELGVQYLSREKNTNAKAGNLNFGLQYSHSDFFMVLDADHITMPHALDKMLGFFSNEKVALVQTPQDFYNVDAFQYMNAHDGRALWHDQSFFHSIAQPCRDTVNGSSCVGTGVVYRRSAIDNIGGIPETTVTEDMHTSLKLQKAGYQVSYLNESVSYGVAASDLKEFYITRHRWANGNLHCLSHENVLFCKGLSLKQRLSYLSLGTIYLEGWQQLLLFIVPLVSLFFGLAPFEISLGNIFIVLLFPFVGYMMLQEIGCGYARFWTNEVFSMARWPIHIKATAGLFGFRIPWKSSHKNVKGRIEWRLMMPQLSVLVASLLAIIFAAWKLSYDFQTGPLIQFLISPNSFLDNIDDIFSPMPQGYTADLVVVAGFWALYNVFRALFFIRKVMQHANESNNFFRFKLPIPVTVGSEKKYSQTFRLSEEWVSFLYDKELPLNSRTGVCIYLPSGSLSFDVDVEKVESVNGEYKVAGRIIYDSQEDRDRLANDLYSVDWQRQFITRDAYFSTLSDVVLSFFGTRLKKPSHFHSLLMAGEMFGVLSGNDKLITFSEYDEQNEIHAVKITGSVNSPIKMIIQNKQPHGPIAERTLNGQMTNIYDVVISR